MDIGQQARLSMCPWARHLPVHDWQLLK